MAEKRKDETTTEFWIRQIQEKAMADERAAILDILVEAARVRDCFHSDGSTLKNSAGHDLFIDATRIDGAIAAIRSRDAVGSSREGS